MVSALTCISGWSGKSRRSRPEICSGDRRLARSASTLARSTGLQASFAGFGLAARSVAKTCAIVARYRPRTPFREISRDTVDGDR